MSFQVLPKKAVSAFICVNQRPINFLVVFNIASLMLDVHLRPKL